MIDARKCINCERENEAYTGREGGGDNDNTPRPLRPPPRIINKNTDFSHIRGREGKPLSGGGGGGCDLTNKALNEVHSEDSIHRPSPLPKILCTRLETVKYTGIGAL